MKKERTFADTNIKDAYEEELENIRNMEELQHHEMDEEDDKWKTPDGFDHEDHQYKPSKAHSASIPEPDDDDEKIDNYLNINYTHYAHHQAQQTQDLPPILNKPWTYSEQPSIKSSYKGKVTDIQRHHWEPLAWALNQLNWDESNNRGGITFIELAILINIMTDGATARDSDVSTQAKLLKIAFPKFYAM